MSDQEKISIDDLIVQTLEAINNTYSSENPVSGEAYFSTEKHAGDFRIVFPVYYDENGKPKNTDNVEDKIRVSEQEARFMFISVLESKHQNKYKYAIEVPTERRYSFYSSKSEKGEKGEKEKPIINNDGRSASADVCLYDMSDPPIKQYIEFKALNGEQSVITKDFIKLLYDIGDDSKPNYFVHILRKTVDQDNSIDSVLDKYKKALYYLTKEYPSVYENKYDNDRSLAQRPLIIYLYVLEDENYYRYDICKNSNYESLLKVKEPLSFRMKR